MILSYYIGCTLAGALFATILTRKAYRRGMRPGWIYWFLGIIALNCIIEVPNYHEPAWFQAGIVLGMLSSFEPTSIIANLIALAIFAACIPARTVKTESSSLRVNPDSEDPPV